MSALTRMPGRVAADNAAPSRAVAGAHAMPFGAALVPDGSVRFRIFAPACETVLLHLPLTGESLPLGKAGEGWHELVTGAAGAGTPDLFELYDGMRVPDPASRHQPDDVHGPSAVVDAGAFAWTDGACQRRPWAEAVIYEVHVGTFTPEGTFRAAIGKLDHLAALGVTAIQLMPVAEYAGRRGWGYDGVLLYAPESAYGHPDDLRALVDAAHARGLTVILDVVYNHFGPDGNYLSAYAPQFFTERHMTPWGKAINYDGLRSDVVRDFMVHNALYWIEEFHVDGLRLDAVHAIVDDSETVLIAEMAERVRGLDLGRDIHLILENEENEASRLVRDETVPGRFTAQWNDDVHHVLHVAATGEGAGYYGDYLGDTGKLGRALAEGFAFQGEVMAYRGSRRGEPSVFLPPDAFVAFVQNHDQIGNRAFGDRLVATAAPAAARAVTAVLLLLPQVPLLFMGEEWGCVQPFPFFCDFEGDLAEAVRKGRREEFKRFPEFANPASRERIPDPLAESTFLSAKLDWSALDRPAPRATLDWYRTMLALRRARILPLMGAMTGRAGTYDEVGPSAVTVRWRTTDGTVLRLDANLKADPQPGFAEPAGETIWREGRADGRVLAPWAVRWTVQP